MPELPEVETVVRNLTTTLTGVQIEGIRCLFPGVLGQAPQEFCRTLEGRTFTGFGRHGKYIFFLLSGDTAVALHLRMTGQLLLAPVAHPPDKHTHLELTLARQERKLVYRDVRKFGRFTLLPWGSERFVQEKRLGPDALSITPVTLGLALGGTSRILKAALLDQSVLAGLGNIYTDEILFRSGLSPRRRAASLSEGELLGLCGNIREVLLAAIAGRGTSISDYLDLEGQSGSFQFALQVYGRTGQACERCGAPIERALLAGRGTWSCPVCQG